MIGPMKVESRDTSVRSLLKSAYYLVPRFQRAYSWDRENVEDFWTDTIQESAGDYFIGAMVVYPESKDTFAVVDGQQRLTTLTLLLSALRDAFESRGDNDRANGTHGFIERPDEDDRPQFVLQTETSHPYLQDRILSRNGAGLSVDIGSEEGALKVAYDRLNSYVKAAISTIEDSSTIPKDEKTERVLADLKRIRERVLDLKLIFVEVDNQDDATLIFETLNARGKDLTVADLIKTHLLGYLRAENKGLDAPRHKWDGIRAKFDASQLDISMTAFLLAVWQSRYEYVNERKLHKAVKSIIKRDKAAGFLDLLVHEAELYRQLIEPGYRKWGRTKEERAAADSLSFLQQFRLRQPMPLLLSLLRDYDAGKLKARQLARAFSLLERFHFAFTVVTQKSSSGGWSFLYARLARELLHKGKDRKPEVIDELESKLADRFPEPAEFIEAFSDLAYSNEFTQQKRTVQYALRRLYEHGSGTRTTDFSRMTIEHLLPQSAGGNRVAELGNLILIDEQLNVELDDQPFEKKKEVLAKNRDRVWVPEDVLHAKDWTDEAIKERTERLAKEAYEEVWALDA